MGELITVFSNSEIYDLVRVDYFSNNLETIKKELMLKAITILNEKIKSYKSILSTELDSMERQSADGYKVLLPVEMYESYKAYNSSSLNLRKSAYVDRADKSTTYYYQPVIDKEFDFVINPVILDPVIQVMYEIKVSINKKEKASASSSNEPKIQYYLITPTGDIKDLKIK